MTLPGQSPDLNVTENMCRTITLKLHIESDVIKMVAELVVVSAACWIWMSLFIEYLQSLCASITCQLHSVVVEE